MFNWYKPEGLSQQQINPLIFENLDVCNVLNKAAKKFDGGYVIAGMIGHGDAFILRDPNGIRPAFYYQDDEVVAMASERPALQTAFELQLEDIKELKPGNALIVKYNGQVKEELCLEPQEKNPAVLSAFIFQEAMIPIFIRNVKILDGNWPDQSSRRSMKILKTPFFIYTEYV